MDLKRVYSSFTSQPPPYQKLKFGVHRVPDELSPIIPGHMWTHYAHAPIKDSCSVGTVGEKRDVNGFLTEKTRLMTKIVNHLSSGKQGISNVHINMN